MRDLVRQYLLKKTPKTLIPIEDGTPGEFSKIREEYLELKDALRQNNKPLTFVEACDLVDATMKFQFKKFSVPSAVVLLVIYLRRLYKPIRNRIYSYAGLGKSDFNS